MQQENKMSRPEGKPANAAFASALVHGGDWAGYAAAYGGTPLDFSANVSPLGMPEGVRCAVCEAAASADRYPDPLCRALCAALAQSEAVPAEQILCGNGAADLIFRAVLARKPRTALLPAPCFAEYEAALQIVGCAVRRHTLSAQRGFAIEEAFLEEITTDVDMVFLCEPNNPTGVTSPRAFLRRAAQRCAEAGALLVLDECFVDFLDDPAAHTMTPFLAEFPNLLILKAFTKLYGMAGVRLGYCLCADLALLAAMRAAGQPWAVSTLAQAAGEATLRETAYVEQVRALIRQERPWLAGQLAQLGLCVVQGEANYLLFQCAAPLEALLPPRGIVVRACQNYPGLCAGWYRTAVRTHAENERLIAVLREVLA